MLLGVVVVDLPMEEDVSVEFPYEEHLMCGIMLCDDCDLGLDFTNEVEIVIV